MPRTATNYEPPTLTAELDMAKLGSNSKKGGCQIRQCDGIYHPNSQFQYNIISGCLRQRPAAYFNNKYPL